MLIISSMLLIVDLVLLGISISIFKDIYYNGIRIKKNNDGLGMLINDLIDIRNYTEVTELVVKPKIGDDSGNINIDLFFNKRN